MRRLNQIIAAAIGTFTLFGASVEHSNGLAIPSELYMLSGGRSHLYTQSYLKRWMPDSYFVRVSGDCEFERRIPEVTTIVNPAEGARFVVDLIEGNEFGVIATDTVTLRVGSPKSSNNVKVQILGDSFVQGSFYRTALVDSTLVSGITTIGLRKLSGTDSHFDEGRGGWTLKSYFTISKGEFTPYSGFMQPTDGRRYLGDCRFWVNCHKVESGELSDFESRYQCGRFEECSKLFDAATGRAVAPKKGDLMWDTDHYICYNGKKWIKEDIDESAWKFSYEKYLAIWNLEAPDFLFETLGLNDFRDSLDADYSEWDSMIAELKDSYLKANPKGKFAIVIPCSSCGSLNNRRGDFTVRQNACMWRFRKHLVDTFDHRKNEGYHLVDMGITIDNENGYRTDKDGLQVGNPHPYPNYPEMGVPLAAFIQYYRN